MKIEGITLSQAAEGIRSGSFSSIDLTKSCLRRIERLNPSLNAFLTVTSQQALAEAKEADTRIKKGEYLGPLHGIPVAVKDLFNTAGIRTTGGSKFLANNFPKIDATSVKNLRIHGAVSLGKTSLHEWALGVTNINPHFGPTLNPWALDRIPGGSSGGSAVAVAAGLSLGALGTDTGGSIRIPSAACGIVGLKPTRGLVSLRGVLPLSWSLDHVGPMAQTAEDCAILLDAICGYDPEDPESVARPEESYLGSLQRPIEGLRIGVSSDYFFEGIDEDVSRSVSDAVKVLEKNGGLVSDTLYEGVEDDVRAAGTVQLPEAAAIHHSDIVERRAEIGADVVQRLETGLDISALEYAKAKRTQAERSRFRDSFFKDVDVLITPTLPIEPPLILGVDPVKAAKRLTSFTCPFNLAGLPAISVPCGFTRNGLPIGLQLIAAHWQESILLRVAHHYENLTRWKDSRPKLE